MSGDLYPTPTRLALLDDVDTGHVVTVAGDTFDAALPGTGKVTARMTELYAAGWVERPDGSQWWRLTDAGRAVRAEHPERPS